MSTMLLEIVTPERRIFSNQVEMVVVEGVSGELGILPRHIPLVTPLRIAPVKVKRDGKEEFVAVQGGFIEVHDSKVVILAENAELPGDIDVNRAIAAKERAERRLANRQQDFDYARAEIALQKALNRINVHGKDMF